MAAIQHSRKNKVLNLTFLGKIGKKRFGRGLPSNFTLEYWAYLPITRNRVRPSNRGPERALHMFYVGPPTIGKRSIGHYS